MALYIWERNKSTLAQRFRDTKYSSWEAMRSISKATCKPLSSLKAVEKLEASAMSSWMKYDLGSVTLDFLGQRLTRICHISV